MSMPASRFQTLQACRGVAALLVVLFHASGAIGDPKYFGDVPFGGLFGFGHAGVELFFVLSGFIIVAAHSSDLGRSGALPAYLWKRVVRIFPAYWVVYLTLGAILFLAPPGMLSAPPSVLSAFGGFFLIPQDPRLVGGTGAPILIVAWSLQYELVFYSLFAALIFNLRIGFTAILVVLLISLGSGSSSVFPLSFLGNAYPWLFVLGATVAIATTRGWSLPAPRLIATVGAMAFVGTGLLELSDSSFKLSLAYGVSSAILVWGLVTAELKQPNSRLAPLWLQRVGDASYSIYLTHFAFISVGCKVLIKSPHLSAHFAFGLAVAIGVGGGLIFYRWIERPLLHFFHVRPPWLKGNKTEAVQSA